MLVALGVSGGIAAYKACEIVRGLDKAGAAVQVLLTENGARFVTPLTLQTLSRRKVVTRTFDLADENTIRHIELTREIDALVVAPATANVLAKFAHGIADDFLSTFYVSATVPVLVAPAMNTRMWLHPATQANLARLRERGVEVIGPADGWLAEQESGVGRMADPADIVAATLAAAGRGRQLAGRKVVVTAGPTQEPVDPVRYLTNRSSGKMGHALADAAARRGAEVHLVSGPVDLPVPFGVQRVDVRTVEQMREATLRLRSGAWAVFMSAAVSDYVPRAAPSKIKKTGGTLTLTLDEGPDILAELGRDRQEGVLVGFAAETDDLTKHAQSKLARKNLDFIVANDVSRADIGFDASDNEVHIFGRDGGHWHVPRASKRQVADSILDRVLAQSAEVRMRGDLGEWVAYLKDIGVRDLAAPRAPRRRAAMPATPRTPLPARSPSPPARKTQQVLMTEHETPFSDPAPADPAARLLEIRTQMGECTRCKLHEGRTNIVFGVGNPKARILFIGEGPGENEDLQGEPFVGRAGQKLDEMIAAIGLSRAEVYIANIVKCRPPGNRDPEPDEVTTCSPFLVAQIEAIRPKVIVTLGGPSTKLILGTRVGITRLRGQWHSYRGIAVMPTFHPAYVLRNYTRQTRNQVWTDLKAAAARASEAGPPAAG